MSAPDPVDEYGLTAQEREWIEVPDGATVEKSVTPEGAPQVTVSSVMAADDPRNQPVEKKTVTTALDGTVTIVEPLAAGCTRTASINRPAISNRTLPVTATLSVSTGCSSQYFTAEGWAPDWTGIETKLVSAQAFVSPGNSTTVSTSYACGEDFRYWTNRNRATNTGAELATSARVWLRC
ncbi:MAG: hypothetical protein IE923_08005 [Micrococcales bacterium]|nr:hypothetical protein [Micrococcales bacterium]